MLPTTLSPAQAANRDKGNEENQTSGLHVIFRVGSKACSSGKALALFANNGSTCSSLCASYSAQISVPTHEAGIEGRTHVLRGTSSDTQVNFLPAAFDTNKVAAEDCRTYGS